MSDEANDSRRMFLQGVAAVGGATLLANSGEAAPSSQEPHQTSDSSLACQGGQRLRTLLAGPELIQSPVIYDMVSLKLCEQLGFPTAFAGGRPVSASMYGAGDYGTLTTTELIEFANRAVQASPIPLIADADDGGGSPLNVHRAIRLYENAGVAGVMIEDMYGAKHIPGLPEGPMLPTPLFVDKIRAAVDARKGDMVLIARCDGLSAGEPFEVALERLVAYSDAGADMVFMAGADRRRVPEIAQATGLPVMSTVPPDHPDGEFDMLRKLQIKLAAYAGPLLSIAAEAVRAALVDLKRSGRIRNYTERAMNSEIWGDIIEASASVDVAKRFHADRWP